jgi:hypothetical protein
MKIKLTSLETGSGYIRHARTETLRAVNADVNSALVEPVPCATYLLAYDREGGKPIGMSESAFHSQIYRGYEDGPYTSLCDLNDICPFSRMAGMRTVYVEPEYRQRRPVFLHLVLASARLFSQFGAEYATVTTNAADDYLNNLYEKMGGRHLGNVRMDGVYDSDSSVFVFHLDTVLQHKALRHVTREFDMDLTMAQNIMTRRAA